MAAIDFEALAELVLVAPTAGLVVATAFAFVVLGATRASEARRDGRGAVAGGFAALAVIAAAAFGATVVIGIFLIAQ